MSWLNRCLARRLYMVGRKAATMVDARRPQEYGNTRMVSVTSITKRSNSSVVLLHAGESLLKQITRWGQLRPDADIQLAASALPSTLRPLLSGAIAAVIDATEQPEAAMQTLAGILAVLQRTEAQVKLSVYTEAAHEGLEMFVRLRGILFLIGPMGPLEWDGFFGVEPTASAVGGQYESNLSSIHDNQPGGRRVLSLSDMTNHAPTQD